MKGGAASSPDGAPGDALELLTSFEKLRPAAGLRLWLDQPGAMLRCVYPDENGPAAEAAAPARGDGRLFAVPTEAGPSFELEVSGKLAASELEFLLGALAQSLGQERRTRAAAQAVADRYEEINLLYSISEILGSVLSLERAAKLILTEVADVLQARRASLWVHDPVAQVLDLKAYVGAAGLAGPIDVNDPHSVTARVFRERQTLNLERGTNLPRKDSLAARPHGEEAFLSVPINFTPPECHTRTVGVITLMGRTTRLNFSASDARLLAAIANQVGAALENQRLVSEGLNRQRLERELELAHNLQMKLLPDPAELGLTAEIVARCLPASAVGGDLYHFFQLPENRIGVMIGDVSSHGFSAALIMAMTMSASAISAQEGASPAQVLHRIHCALIGELLTTEMHLSLFYAVIDPRAGRLSYGNAGHPHAFLVRQDGRSARLGALNPPVGTVAADSYLEAESAWEPGDTLVLFTDGLAELFSRPIGSCSSGEAELVRRVIAWRKGSLDQILTQMFAEAKRPKRGVRADDRTAVLVRA